MVTGTVHRDVHGQDILCDFVLKFERSRGLGIPFTLLCNRVMALTQFLPIIEGEVWVLPIGLDAIVKAPFTAQQVSYLHCSGWLEQGLPGLLWACGFRKKTRGEVASTQSALNGTLGRQRAGVDVEENM